jgi:hypothetical protein
MFFVKRKNPSLNRSYSSSTKKIRRKIVNLYRPYNRYSDNPFLSRVDIMAYIMLGLFSLSAVLFAAGFSYHSIPFLFGFFSNVILFVYFYTRPLTWDEMYSYEKNYYRGVFGLPKNWNPN